MKRHLLTLTCIFLTSQIFTQNLSDLSYGTDTTFEVMTWNLEWFPKNGQTTIDSVTRIIKSLKVDVIALQEINNTAAFYQLVDSLDGWAGHVVNSATSGNLKLAYIYRTDVIQSLGIYEIFKFFYEREFPRPPLVMELEFKGEYYVIINNHFKCCGNGSLNQNDMWDEEKRRYDASQLLKNYIGNNLHNQRVIVLGDLNDVLTDNISNNTFQVFLDDADSYGFADMGIATGAATNWSYPGWPSHLDHILMTNEMFSEFDHDSSGIKSIRIGDYLSGGFNQYDAMISDHRPVVLKILSDTSFEPDTTTPPDTITPPDTTTVSINNPVSREASIAIHPNPNKGAFRVDLAHINQDGTLLIYDLMGSIVGQISIPAGVKRSVDVDMARYNAGTYMIRLIYGNKHLVKKLHIY